MEAKYIIQNAFPSLSLPAVFTPLADSWPRCHRPVPTIGTRTTLDQELKVFLSNNEALHLGCSGDIHGKPSHHTKVFGFHSLPSSKEAAIHEVEFTAIRDPEGTIPIRVFCPESGEGNRKSKEAGAVV